LRKYAHYISRYVSIALSKPRHLAGIFLNAIICASHSIGCFRSNAPFSEMHATRIELTLARAVP
jgi:hypothetical protein